MGKEKRQVLKSDTKKIYKNKELNNAAFKDFSHTDYQVFLLLISKLGGVDERGKYLQPEKLQRELTLSAYEFQEMFNVPQNDCYVYLKKACKKLMAEIIRIEDEKKISWINVCSKADYIKGNGNILVKFTEDIMPYLVQVKERFVLYNTKEIAMFGSLYTTRLYELLLEFQDTGWRVFTVDELRCKLAVETKMKKYNHLKQKVLLHAVNEINTNYSINLTFTEHKTGRKVTAIKFTFNQGRFAKHLRKMKEKFERAGIKVDNI